MHLLTFIIQVVNVNSDLQAHPINVEVQFDHGKTIKVNSHNVDLGLNAITDMQPTVLNLDKDCELVIMNHGSNHQVVDLQGSHAQSTFGA